MSSLGDIGGGQPRPALGIALGQFTRGKQPTTVTIAISPVAVDARVHVFTAAGTFVDRANGNASGVASVYDLDDGTYYAYEIGAGNIWQVVVSGSSATVTQVFSSQRAHAYAWA